MTVQEQVQLTEEKETLFITLYAKAHDYRSKQPLLNDKWADEVLKTVNYDFSKAKGFGHSLTVVRARHFDEWTKEFIQANNNAIVVYLGCGLDARIFRIDPPPSVSWYDVDYPEVISLRAGVYPLRKGHFMIASSVTASGWLEQIPANRPTLILAEGLLEYLTEEQVKFLLNRVTSHFHHGQIIFDVMNTFAMRSGNDKLKQTTGAELRWAVDDVQQVDRLNRMLKRKDTITLITSPYIRQLRLPLRLFLKVFSVFAGFKNMLRVLRYEF